MLSAGICLYSTQLDKFVLVKPGGPFYVNSQNKPVWGFPKGHVEDGEDAQVASIREFEEETGWKLNQFNLIQPLQLLGRIKQNTTKQVQLYLAITNSSEVLPAVKSNFCEMEWPKNSGKLIKVPEVDEAKWVSFEDAPHIMIKGQIQALALLNAALGRISR